MIVPFSLLIATLISPLGRVNAEGDSDAEGTKGSRILLQDTDHGFNVTENGGDFKVLTSYLFNKCSESQQNVLKQAITDANIIAYSGVKELAGPAGTPIDWIDFSHEAAIDFFGPQNKNGGQRDKIFTTLTRASYAYRGPGWSDWWNGRYIQLNCDESILDGCLYKDRIVFAGNSNKNKDFNYPLITFCGAYFDILPSFDEALDRLEGSGDKDRELNTLNLRNKARDNIMYFGPDKERTKAYRPGATKLLAKQNVQVAANNNDNYVFYSLAWFMLRRYGKYPQYPTAWDPSKTVAENLAAQAKQPGNPPPLKDPDTTDDDINEDDPADLVPVTDLLYDPSEYPDWYKPIVTANQPTSLPAVTPPPAPTEPPSDFPTIPMDEPSPPSSITSSSTSSPTRKPTPAPATDTCDVSYKFLYDEFEVRGKNFDASKFGKDGSGLEKQISGCGDLTEWHFEWTPKDPKYQWHVSGHLPIGTKNCIGNAVESAGGSSKGNCNGAG
ncbi:MAG: hypothetical protein Q9227_000016 [Pyrenula ochraceoflavens]